MYINEPFSFWERKYDELIKKKRLLEIKLRDTDAFYKSQCEKLEKEIKELEGKKDN